MRFLSFLRHFVFSCLLAAIASVRANGEWTPLLDKDLTQWDTYLGFRHDTSFSGKPPLDAAGKPIEPVGYGKNPVNIFSTVQVDGRLALRISGEIYGCAFTKKEFSNYRLKLKVKWGEKKWPPRLALLKDSGILYHSVGPAGVDYWLAWMRAQEFQVMQGHIGDYWSIAGSAVDIRAFQPEGAMNAVASASQPFLPFGAKPSVSGFCLREENRESPPGEWTDVELVCFEDRALHIVNGHVVMVLKNSRYMDDGKPVPLTKGKIQLQSEAAEVFYSDIQIQSIDRLPPEFEALYR